MTIPETVEGPDQHSETKEPATAVKGRLLAQARLQAEAFEGEEKHSDRPINQEESGQRPRFYSVTCDDAICEASWCAERSASCGVPTRGELCKAVERGELTQVQKLVEMGGMDLNEAQTDGQYAMLVAAAHRHCHEVLTYILRTGASTSVRDNDGASPLHVAVLSRNVLGVRTLLSFGVDVDAKDGRDRTPLFMACQIKAVKAIAELLQGGADPTVTEESSGRTPLHILVHACTPESSQVRARKNRSGSRSFMRTSLPPWLESVTTKMVDAGASVIAKDGSGLTVLDAAAAYNLQLMHFMLLRSGMGSTDVLLHAIKHGDTLAAKQILDSGDVEARSIIDDHGNCLLHLAATAGSLECVILLLTGRWLQTQTTAPFVIDARNSSGQTALFKATFHAHLDIVAFLLDFGACPAIQDMSGRGVGYTFAEMTTPDEIAAVCELLQRWSCRSEGERERAESSASLKAPDGDVVFLSGVVPLVSDTKTKHLLSPVHTPPPPAPTPHAKNAGGKRAVEPTFGFWGEWQHIERQYTSMDRYTFALENERLAQGHSDGAENPWRGNDLTDDQLATVGHTGGATSRGGSYWEETMRDKVEVKPRKSGKAKYAASDDRNTPEMRQNSAADDFDLNARVTRAVSSTSQRSEQSIESVHSARSRGTSRERQFREFSGGGKVRARAVGGDGRHHRDYSGASESREEGFRVARGESASGNSERSTTCDSSGFDQMETSKAHSASPRRRYWKLRPRTTRSTILSSSVPDDQEKCAGRASDHVTATPPPVTAGDSGSLRLVR